MPIKSDGLPTGYHAIMNDEFNEASFTIILFACEEISFPKMLFIWQQYQKSLQKSMAQICKSLNW